MKKHSLIVIALIGIGFLLTVNFNANQESGNNENVKINEFIRIWGAIKYYSKTASIDSVNMDSIFFNTYPKIKTSSTNEEYNLHINKLLSLYTNKFEENGNDEMNTKTIDLCLYKKSKLINDTNKQLLEDLFLNKKNFNCYYVDYIKNIYNTKYNNETSYEDSINPSEATRMLALARYWNIINYFYPNKSIIDQNWDSVLLSFIPKFKAKLNSREYTLLTLELVKTINDSHSFTYSRDILEFLGYYDMPFKIKKVSDEYIIYDFYSDSIENISQAKIGDIILRIDNKNVDSLVKIREQYTGGSNARGIVRNAILDILCSNKKDSAKIHLLRNKDTLLIITDRYYLTDLFKLELSDQLKLPKIKYLNDSICYLNLGIMDTNDIINNKLKMLNSSGLIIDVRMNSNNTLFCLSRILNSDRIKFVEWYLPDTNYPGNFNFVEGYFTGPKNFNPDHYKGIVCLLVNEHTQSHGEFTTMALQTAPNAVTIGSQTAGADGNVSYFSLPGGITTYFSGIGVYYPDLSPTQRVGIRIDHEVKPTIEGIRNGKDEVLEYAINFINNQK